MHRPNLALMQSGFIGSCARTVCYSSAGLDIPQSARRHDGKVAVEQSNARWCSDGFEFRCDDGAPLRVVFALDCCDREAISWVASTGGYTGDMVRDVMLQAVENCFHGALKTDSQIEWLSDNGSCYIADETLTFRGRSA